MAIERISNGLAGVPANGSSTYADDLDVSRNGRYVVFSSTATNMVTNEDLNGIFLGGPWDVFVYDRITGLTELLSHDALGAALPSNLNTLGSGNPFISDDGRYVAFDWQENSTASYIYLYDRAAGTWSDIIPRTAPGHPGGHVSLLSMTADASHLLFSSTYTVLDSVPSDDNYYIYNRLTDTVSPLDLPGGTLWLATDPVMSDDGKWVTFTSNDDIAAAGDSNGTRDVFLMELDTSTITRLPGVNSMGPSVSADGRYVAYLTDADLVAGDTNGAQDVYVYDRTDGSVDLVFVNGLGQTGNDFNNPWSVRISADGRFVTLTSASTNLDTSDADRGGPGYSPYLDEDVFLYDRQTDTITMLSKTAGGLAADNYSEYSAISADGLTYVFGSKATNLVAGDTNGFMDVFAVSLDTRFSNAVDTYTLIASGELVDALGGDDKITGAAGDDAIRGGAGKDTLVGNDGDDGLDGGTGDDTMTGGKGDDSYVVDSLKDIVTENSGEGLDTIVSNVASYTLSANVENMVLRSLTALKGTGNDLDNRMTGNAAANTLDGGKGNDTLFGKDGKDTLKGGEGNDWLYGEGAEDTLDGGAGGDKLFGDLGSDKLIGGTGEDELYGAESSDTLIGGDDNDKLDGGAGADAMAGGKGDDTYYVDDLGDKVTEAAKQGEDTIIASVSGYKLAAGVENLKFSVWGHYTATGNKEINRLWGNDGFDTLKGMEGNDFLQGSENGADGALDTLEGGKGDDTYRLIGEIDSVVELANEGNDTVETDYAFYDLNTIEHVENITNLGTGAFGGTGNAAANRIVGNVGDDTLTGNDGNDTLDGGAAATTTDTLDGGEGSDTYVVRHAGVVVIEAGIGASDVDTVESYLTDFSLADPGLDGIEKLTMKGSGLGSRLATGNLLANTITGSDDAETLEGGGVDGKVDVLKGGKGDDLYLVSEAEDVVVEAAGEGADQVSTALEGYTLTANVESLYFTDGANHTGIGNAGDNTITGNTGIDTLEGRDGNDTLEGSDGADDAVVDTLKGGKGNDTYVVRGTMDTIEEKAGEGTDTLRTDIASIDLATAALLNVENLAYIGSGSFTGQGNALANAITGGAGVDSLSGGDGNDILDGFDFSDSVVDTLTGGKGDDTYLLRGDLLFDTVVENAGEGTKDTVWSYQATATLAANVENGVVKGNGGELIGNGLANVLTGSDGNDALDGGAGETTPMADQLKGGKGDDTYVIRDAKDKITEVKGEGSDTVKTDLFAYTLGMNLENLTFTDNESHFGKGNKDANTMTGGGGADRLEGLDGNDELLGGLGADTLIGGNGADKLTGGGDADIFVLDARIVNGVFDQFTDFDAAEDVISLKKAVFSGLGGTDNRMLDPLELFLTANFLLDQSGLTAQHRFIYDTATGQLFYDRDGSKIGGAAAVQIAVLDGAPALSTDNLMVGLAP